MQKSKRPARNTRKKPSSKRPILYLLITAIVIGVVIYYLDHARKPVPVETPEPPTVTTPEKPAAPPKKTPPPEEIVKPGKTTPEVAKPVQKQYSTPAVVLPPVKMPKIPGESFVAIIIDDMGANLSEVRQLMNIGVPLTFSIIPGLRQSREVALAAHAKGYEVMLHIPMEPRDYPLRRLESNGLLLSYSDGEIESRVRDLMNVIPHVVGANNHMGSRFTENRVKMGIVLKVLKEHGMFFVDSVTTPKSVGLSLSREMGLRATARNAPFLDNSEDVSAIKQQLASLARMAVKKGSAVGICHPHAATIRALAEELPAMRKDGIRFVYVSKLVR